MRPEANAAPFSLEWQSSGRLWIEHDNGLPHHGGTNVIVEITGNKLLGSEIGRRMTQRMLNSCLPPTQLPIQSAINETDPADVVLIVCDQHPAVEVPSSLDILVKSFPNHKILRNPVAPQALQIASHGKGNAPSKVLLCGSELASLKAYLHRFSELGLEIMVVIDCVSGAAEKWMKENVRTGCPTKTVYELLSARLPELRFQADEWNRRYESVYERFVALSEHHGMGAEMHLATSRSVPDCGKMVTASLRS